MARGAKRKAAVDRKEQMVSALVDADMKKRIADRARDQRVSESHVLREALRQYLYSQEKAA